MLYLKAVGERCSCYRIFIVKLKRILNVIKNKRREVPRITMYDIMVIMLPKPVFNLYSARAVDCNL